MDKHNNYLREMTATADNTLSLNVALLLHYDWHIMKKTHTLRAQWCTNPHPQAIWACIFPWCIHKHTDNVKKTTADTQQNMCLLYMKKMIWGTTTVAIKGQFEMVKLNIRGSLHAHFVVT